MLWAVFGVLLFLPALCRAENCPMLNAATAGGLLGGEVTMEVTRPGPTDVTCKFALKTGSTHAQLEIMVHTMTTIGDEFPQILAECGASSTPLKAIGNQAVRCSKSDGASEVEEIVSRVRERAFILKWTKPKSIGDTASETEDSFQEKIRNVGEQVAGSLF